MVCDIVRIPHVHRMSDVEATGGPCFLDFAEVFVQHMLVHLDNKSLIRLAATCRELLKLVHDLPTTYWRVSLPGSQYTSAVHAHRIFCRCLILLRHTTNAWVHCMPCQHRGEMSAHHLCALDLQVAERCLCRICKQLALATPTQQPCSHLQISWQPYSEHTTLAQEF